MAVDAFTDCIGCMVAGPGEPIAGILENIIFDATDRPETPAALMAVSGRRVSSTDAALYNGALAHAVDYDDVTHPAYAHPEHASFPQS